MVARTMPRNKSVSGEEIWLGVSVVKNQKGQRGCNLQLRSNNGSRAGIEVFQMRSGFGREVARGGGILQGLD